MVQLVANSLEVFLRLQRRLVANSVEVFLRLQRRPGHIFMECPDFKCFRCQKTGHYARECEERNAATREEEEERGEQMTEGELKRRLEVMEQGGKAEDDDVAEDTDDE
ncbi:unnamed protein product [Gadus morhua 'NCC']